MILGRKGSGSSSGGGGADDQTAAEVPFTPAGAIAATDVQAAIEEVAAEAGAGGAMVLLSDTVLGVDTASFDIASIPATYKHLKIVLYARSTDAATLVPCGIRFNNDSGDNYHSQQVAGVGATATAYEPDETAPNGQLADIPGATSPANYFGMSEALIPNYAAVTGFKPCTAHGIVPSDATTMYMEVFGFHWRSTNAINRVTVLPGSGSFLAGSRLTIYGLG